MKKLICLPTSLLYNEEIFKRAYTLVNKSLLNFNIKDNNSYSLKIAIYSDGSKHTSFVINNCLRIQYDYTVVYIKRWCNQPFFKLFNTKHFVKGKDVRRMILFGIFFRLSINEYNTCTEVVLKWLIFFDRRKENEQKSSTCAQCLSIQSRD